MPSVAASSFAALPRQRLQPSAWVDFLHFLVLEKQAVRVKPQVSGIHELARWSAQYGYEWDADEEGFCCVASSKRLARQILEIDRRTDPHELELGLLLGYPRCCCEAISLVGERKIDEHAKTVAAWQFESDFRFINPSAYLRGASLICHLPCSPNCAASLEIAVSVWRFLKRYLSYPVFRSWSAWASVL